MDSEVFSCDQCTATFQQAKKLEMHIAWRHGKQSYHCKQCQLSFASNSQFIQHQKSHKKGHPCSFCGKTFSMAASLKVHLQSHAKQSKKHSCDVCGMKFRLKSVLLSHSKIHSPSGTIQSPHGISSSGRTGGIIAKKNQCSQCHESFARKRDLQSHKKKNHSPVSIVKTAKPSQSSKHSADDYKPNGIEAQLECSPNYLMERDEDVSSDGGVEDEEMIFDVPYSEEESSSGHTCPVCREYFKSKTDLDKHITKHGNIQHNKPTVGNSLGLVVEKEVWLSNSGDEILPLLSSKPKETTAEIHEQSDPSDSDSEDSSPENVEGNELSKKSLQDLLKILKNPLAFQRVTTKKTYGCGTCRIPFHDKEISKTHMKEHHNKVVYECEICCELFVGEKALREHKVTHLWGEKCEHCEVKCSTDVKLEWHRIVAHGDAFVSECQPCVMSLIKRKVPKSDAMHQTKARVESLVPAVGAFHCDHCSQKFENLTNFREHLRQNMDGLSHKCSFCPKLLSSLSQKKFHERLHTGEKPFKCSLCENTFRTSHEKKSHEKRKHENVLFKCSYCPRTFKEAQKRKEHQWTHTGERNYKCSFCPKTFKTHGSRVAHELLHKRPSKCSFCDKTFPGPYRKKLHERIHTGERSYKCAFCPKAFHTSASRIIHEQIHSKSYMCCFCSRTFAQRRKLVDHERNHRGERPYKCPLCPKSFITASTRNVHAQIHTTDHICHICSRGFNSDAKLRRHMGIHNHPHKCTACPKSFRSEALLKNHIMNNHKDVPLDENDPHKCTDCPRSFKTEGLLKKHMKKHQDYTHRCTACSKPFKSEACLNNHVVKKHKGMSLDEDSLVVLPIPEEEIETVVCTVCTIVE